MELEIKAPRIDGKVRCQNGYVYIDKPYWNAEKQRASHKREYIGTYDGTKFIPNRNHQLEAQKNIIDADVILAAVNEQALG